MKYAFDRIVMALLVAITISVIGFMLLRLSGDLATVLAGQDATEEQIRTVAEQYGLDRPLIVQYFNWLGGVLHGDLGTSLFTKEPVTQLIGDRIGVTVTLAFLGLALALAVAIPLGVLAAAYANSWIDRVASLFAVSAQAVPNFWLALILIFLFGVKLRWLPFVGSDTPAHFVLPSIVLAMMVMPALMRLTRSATIEVLDADYIRTAYAKGLSVFTVLMKHALRNAILPVVSLASVSFGFLLGGSVIVESVFGLNGIGLLAFNSILRADFPVVQSILVLVSFAYIILTMLADLINSALDPRIAAE